MISRLLPLRAKESLKLIAISVVLLFVYYVSGAQAWVWQNPIASAVAYALGIVLAVPLGLHLVLGRRSVRDLLLGLFFLLLALFWGFLLYSKLFGSN